MKLHYLNGYIQNIYLAEYADKLLLLDGCCRADIAMIENFIVKELKRSMSDLALIVVTHMHPDHAGAANILRKKYGCKVAAANVPGQWYSGIDGKLMHLTDMLLTLWVAGRQKKAKKYIYYSSSLTPDYYLVDQAILPGFEDWQVHFTQGHTDRDISLHHKASEQIYVADLMVKVRGAFIPPYPVFYPNRYIESLKKIKALNVESVLLAHGAKVQLTEQQWQQLIAIAPTKPATHWRSVKTKLKRVLLNQ
ncbi:MBL fold metallo-hydrolase [Colwellia sp. BRX10-3]|uniref:MBL fold metallo-hydrolase n=1 Tax=Colwellia sp. BRX10-3 TaxID=2759844 RepID=UPI0015F54147|nr:MBL fold metallo-hydrolase [Colwellia sp. BRX10-3]MBA6390548.1 MBL fold metallo-hydrolase [Colwellia sp. BRX10-3]